MPPGTLSYWDYVKAAFHRRVKLPLLGFFPLNKLLLTGFFILGLGHVGFWFLGAAYEIAYLMLLSGSASFQKLVQGERLMAIESQQALRSDQVFKALDIDAQTRYARLVDQCRKIAQSSAGLSKSINLSDLSSSGLNQMIEIYLKLLMSQRYIKDMLSRTQRPVLEREIRDLEARLAREPVESAIARSLKGTLDIQKRRLDNLQKAADNLAFTEAELNRIEMQISLLSEEMTISTGPAQMTDRVDNVVASLQETTRWMSENSELLGAMDAQIIPANLMDETRRIE